MTQRRGSNKWDVVIDGNNFKILKGQQEQGYSHAFQFVAATEQERFSPEQRGHMQSRPDLRAFVQTDWSGGQTWFKPLLPNQDGRTYFQSSLFDAFSKPGNLVPLNDVVQTTFTESIRSPHMVLKQSGIPMTVLSTTESLSSNLDVGIWDPATATFLQVTSAPDTAGQHNMLASQDTLHGLVYSRVDDLIWSVSDDHAGVNEAEVNNWDPDNTVENLDVVTSVTLDFSPGTSMFVFDGEEMWYDGNIVTRMNGTTASIRVTVSDDKMGRDMLSNVVYFDASSGDLIVDPGAIALAVATDRGIYYVKNTPAASGQPQARIYRVQVTDAGSYIREPIGSLPEGLLALNCRWHMDSLLIIATPDWGQMAINDRGEKYFRSQLWHYTQGSVGAVGMFDGDSSPSEAPLYFPKSEGTTQFISSDQRMWAFDSVRGGLHQVFDYPTAFDSGIISATQAFDASVNLLDLYLGKDYHLQSQKAWTPTPRTGNWAAKSYTMVSNYFDFGVSLETKELVSVTALFEKGTSAETFFIDVQNDDDGSWTVVATMTADNGGVPIVTDITSSAITGNRFQYRVRLQVASGTGMPEFRGVGFKALSGETVEVWNLILDGTEITNVENEKQDPNVVLAALKVSAAKNVYVSFTDKYERSDADQSAVDVYVNSATIVKGDQGEAMFQVQLTKVDV